MKKALSIFILFFALNSFQIYAQPEHTPLKKGFKRHTFKIGLGLGFEDALIRESHIPSISLAYEYSLNKYFSLNAHLFSFYRANGDVVNYPFKANLDKYTNSINPRLTEVERQELKEKGIVGLNGYKSFKKFTLPVDISFTAYPLSLKKHKLGINFGLCVNYSELTWYRDYTYGKLTLDNNTFSGDINLLTNTAFRHISGGTTLKVLYEFHFKDYLIGTRMANYNVIPIGFFDQDLYSVVWETSLYFGFKF